MCTVARHRMDHFIRQGRAAGRRSGADHLRRVCELSLTPGMNVQDGFLTSHLERTFYKHESELMREYLGAPDDIIDCPTESQRVLFGPKRRRVPAHDRSDQSRAARPGAESRALHAGRRRAPQ